jgi:hypothetical protein
MTLIIQKPTTSKLILAKTYVGIDDPDAAVYIASVEAADEAESPGVGALETATKVAIHSFVKGCKNDGIWPAIKASCILAGARTLTGALVPLVGTAPTNVGPFVSGDYNRETGLLSDGSTKGLSSNRNNNADPQNNKHMSVYATVTSSTAGKSYIGTTTGVGASFINTSFAPGSLDFRCNTSTLSTIGANSAGFIGVNRSSALEFTGRSGNSSTTVSASSTGLLNAGISVFSGTSRINARLAFYSIGESLDLALLDARVTTLINAFAAAIP